MQSIVNQLPNEFTNLKRVAKSYIPVANAIAWIDVLVGQSINEINNKFKDKIITRRKEQIFKPIKEIDTHEEFRDITNKITSKEIQISKSAENDENEKISLSYISMRKRLNYKKKTVVDNTFVLQYLML